MFADCRCVFQNVVCLPQLFNFNPGQLRDVLHKCGLTKPQVSKATSVVNRLPQVDVKWTLESNTIEADGNGTISIEIQRNKVRACARSLVPASINAD
jgi:hypothetical protein